MVHTRQRVYPFLLLKNYIKTVPYQGNARKFFYALLEQLEDRVPYYEEQLIAGNEQEMLSDKGTYTLYFRNANTLYSTELVFIGGFQLRKECKEFCLNYAKFGSKNLNIEKASLVSGIFRQLFSIMFNDLDIYIESIVSLTSSDVKILLSYLIQSSEFAYTTIKKRILLLGKFYAYITGIEPTNPASAFYKLKLPVGESIHTTPISKAAKECIIKEVSTAPPVYSVGIKIAFATGMRDGTFDTLTTDSLVYTQGHYVIRYFLKKTYKYRIDDAYNYLIDTHQTVNRSSLSRESGVSRVTLNNPAISEHLKKIPEFAPKQNRSDTKSIKELLREQEILKEALKKAQNRSRRLANENQHIKQEYKELNESHQKLLGAYQKLTEDKLIRL